MNATDATRAAQLVEALGRAEAIRADLGKQCAFEGEARALEIGAPCTCDSGSNCDNYMYLPPDLGAHILPFVEHLIREELGRLGVEVTS